MSVDASVRVSLDDFSLEVELQVADGELLAVLQEDVGSAVAIHIACAENAPSCAVK